MTAAPESLGGKGRPFSPHRLIAAAGRTLAVVLGLYLLIAVRADEGFNEALLFSLALFVGLYVLYGRKGALRPVILYIIAMAVFTQVRSFADQTGVPTSYSYVIDMERAAFGQLPNVWLQDQLYKVGHASLLDIYAATVYFSYFFAFQVAALVVWLTKRSLFPMYATAIVLAAYIGLLACVIVPTAPPWLAAEEGDIPPVHRSVKELLSRAEPGAYDDGARVVGVNDVAAMPSLHMAMSVLVMLITWRLSKKRLLRLASAGYAVSMAFALVYLGEHYVIDEFFGVITAGVAWYCADKLWLGNSLRFRMPGFAWSAANETLPTGATAIASSAD